MSGAIRPDLEIVNPREYAGQELHAYENVVVQQKEHDDMASQPDEDRLKQSEREPRRTSSSAQRSEPIRAPFLADGLELVRDSHC
jgi:hypothetical protein